MAIWARACLAMVLALAGCSSPEPVGPGDAETGYRTMYAMGTLDTVHLRGLVELHWSDDEGTHQEQGDLEVWMRGNDHVSARVTKFGDVYFWSGSTPEGSFTFDLASEPTTLTTADTVTGAAAVLPAAALRRLLGIAGLPAEAVSTSGPNVVHVELDRADGSHEVLDLDAAGRLVKHITITTADGAVVTAEHREHDRGIRLGGHTLARYVDVRFDSTLMRLLLAEGSSPTELPEAVFDLERLRLALRPDRVEFLKDTGPSGN